MNDFYDLNDLLAFYLRKIKLVILIVLIGAVGFAGFRFVSNYRQYSTQDPQTTQSNVAGEEPTWKKVTYVIQIEPQYEESVSGVIDTTKQVTDAFARCARSQDVMDELMDKYFETEKQEDVSRKESFSQYGYILDKEKDYPYTAYDFMNQCVMEQDTNGVDYVSVGFRSTNMENAEAVGKEYADLLLEKVKEISGGDAEIVDKAVSYELPSRSEGATSTRKLDSSASTSTMTKATVIKQTIKGAVWGGVIGGCVIVFCLFFLYYVSKKIRKSSDLKNQNVELLGIYTSKKTGKFHKWIHKLEGNDKFFNGVGEFVEYLYAVFEAQNINEGKILICGGGNTEKIEGLVRELEKMCPGSKYSFEYKGSLLSSGAAVKEAKTSDYSIVVECFNKSLIDDIKEEAAKCSEYGVKVLGMVGIE